MNRASMALALAFVAPLAAAQPIFEESDDIETISGKTLPEMAPVGPRGLPTGRWTDPAIAGSVDDAGAAMLDLSPEYVRRTREGLALVFHRKYREARQHFRQLDADIPGTGISGTVDALTWQALMLENFDFRYDKQYGVANAAAIKGLETALKDPRHQAWEHLQLAGLKGIEAIHMVRHGVYVSALNRAFEAMDHVQSARAASPGYSDLGLADGMYNYWRTVVTLSSKLLPSFGDQRALGIAQLQEVEKSGIFLREPATLALAFSYLEERKYSEALAACERNRKIYPDNVINNLLAGSSYTFLGRHDEAIAVYQHILRTAPENNRVYYFLGLTQIRKGLVADGIASFERYLKSDHLEDWQRAATHFRLGQAHYRAKDYAAAEREYRSSHKIDGNKSAKRALDRMIELRREGRIAW